MRFVRVVLLTGLLGMGGCCDLLGPCESDSNVVAPPAQALGKPGCYAASYSAGSGYGDRIGTSLGNPYYDQKMSEEVGIQRMFFNGVPASVWILYESSPQQKNAYASPDGHILFGYHMFYYTVQSFNELAVAGVLAHEWGHQTQFVHNWPTGNPGMELEADAFSGYYMGLAKQWAWSQIQGYFANTYALGDYHFNHPSHHGTPDQRLAAAYLGVNTAIQVIRTGRPFSYQELHALFTQQLGSRVAVGRIAPETRESVPGEALSETVRMLNRLPLEEIASGRARGPEVVYPRRLELDEVRQLRPFDRLPSGTRYAAAR